VQRIVRAYDEHKTRIEEEQMLLLAEPKAESKVDSKSVDPSAAANEKPTETQAKATSDDGKE